MVIIYKSISSPVTCLFLGNLSSQPCSFYITWVIRRTFFVCASLFVSLMFMTALTLFSFEPLIFGIYALTSFFLPKTQSTYSFSISQTYLSGTVVNNFFHIPLSPLHVIQQHNTTMTTWFLYKTQLLNLSSDSWIAHIFSSWASSAVATTSIFLLGFGSM